MAEVYIITCIKNGKKYVGLTRNEYMERFSQHLISAFQNQSSCVIHKAMRKHGTENFVVECVYESDDIVMCGIMEQYLISTMGTITPNGYNATGGGETVIPEGYRKPKKKKTKEVKICVGCGKEFEVRRSGQKFCMNHCRTNYHNQEKLRKSWAIRRLEEQEKEAGD